MPAICHSGQWDTCSSAMAPSSLSRHDLLPFVTTAAFTGRLKRLGVQGVELVTILDHLSVSRL